MGLFKVIVYPENSILQMSHYCMYWILIRLYDVMKEALAILCIEYVSDYMMSDSFYYAGVIL